MATISKIKAKVPTRKIATAAKVPGRSMAPNPTSVPPTPAVTALPAIAPDLRPAFPVEVFQGPVADFVRKVASAMSCPEDFVGVAVLVVAGGAIGAARGLSVKGGNVQRPGMYAVIVSRPGTAKTPALNAVVKPLQEAQFQMYQTFNEQKKKFDVDLAAYEQAATSGQATTPTPQRPIRPVMRHLLTTDTTVEALAANLMGNPKYLIFSDELTAWVRAMNQYKSHGADRQFFLTGWSSEPILVDRKSAPDNPIYITNHCVCVLGGIQPDLLNELQDKDGRDDGFLHRILFCYPPELKTRRWTDVELTTEDQADWDRVLQRLLQLNLEKDEDGHEHPKTLRFSSSGRQAYTTWYNALQVEMDQEDFPDELRGPWAKIDVYCARFALVVHLLHVACDQANINQNGGEVDAEDVRHAACLCTYFKAHYRAAFQSLNESSLDRQVGRVVKYMRDKSHPRLTPRELQRAGIPGIKTSTGAEAILKAAVDRGLGTWEKQPATKSQRASQIFVFGPVGD